MCAVIFSAFSSLVVYGKQRWCWEESGLTPLFVHFTRVRLWSTVIPAMSEETKRLLDFSTSPACSKEADATTWSSVQPPPPSQPHIPEIPFPSPYLHYLLPWAGYRLTDSLTDGLTDCTWGLGFGWRTDGLTDWLLRTRDLSVWRYSWGSLLSGRAWPLSLSLSLYPSLSSLFFSNLYVVKSGIWRGLKYEGVRCMHDPSQIQIQGLTLFISNFST